jgi:hypothetical protein
MTKVIHLPSPRAGTRAQSNAHTTTTTPSPAQQAAIENALVMALHFIRQPGDHAADLWAATARTNRALTLLKHAGGINAPAGASNVFGRG